MNTSYFSTVEIKELYAEYREIFHYNDGMLITNTMNLPNSRAV